MILFFMNQNHEKVLNKFLTLRQQSKKAEGIPNIALSDFISPLSKKSKIILVVSVYTADLVQMSYVLNMRKKMMTIQV